MPDFVRRFGRIQKNTPGIKSKVRIKSFVQGMENK